MEDPQNTVSEASSVLNQAEAIGNPECSVGQHQAYGNPRYNGQRCIKVNFQGYLFVTLYDLAELPEQADGTEVDEEACEACVGCEGHVEPPAIVTKGHLRLVIDN